MVRLIQFNDDSHFVISKYTIVTIEKQDILPCDDTDGEMYSFIIINGSVSEDNKKVTVKDKVLSYQSFEQRDSDYEMALSILNADDVISFDTDEDN